MKVREAIVIGCGGMGSAAIYHLALRGVPVLGLDRFETGHDRGSSHGRTRIIRQAYFEHSDYVPLARRAYEGWAQLETRVGQPLWRRTGLVQMGPRDGHVLRGVMDSAARFELEIETFSAAEARRRFAPLTCPDDMAAVLEPGAGYLRVEACVRAHCEAAVALGAELQTDAAVLGWRPQGDVFAVVTERETHYAARLILAPGAWANTLLGDMGLPLEVRRKPQLWFSARDDRLLVERGCPAFLVETPAGIFYGFPVIDANGLKVAEHTSGERVTDPLALDRTLRPDDTARIETFLAEHLPEATGPVLGHAVCMYTMSPDEHFILDRHPRHSRVAFVAGMSGHGFKFAPVIGRALSDWVLDGRTDLEVEFLGRNRPALNISVGSAPRALEDDREHTP